MTHTTNQKGATLNLIFVIVAVVGVVIYFGWRSLNSNPTPVLDSSAPIPTVTNDEINNQILRDIVEGGVNCDLEDADGNVVKDTCRVEKMVGDYAKGIMPQAYWMAVKTEGKWKVTVTGNGIPTCEEIDKNSFPSEIYANCIEVTGELRY